jgi:outer membrane protein TolC
MISFLIFLMVAGAEIPVYTLDDCIDLALKYDADLRDCDTELGMNNLAVQNFKTSYYPTMSMSATGSYQTGVQTVTLPIPGVQESIELGGKDQYRAELDISQLIYDGHKSRLHISRLQTKQQSVEYKKGIIKSEVVFSVTIPYLRILETDQAIAVYDSQLNTLNSLKADVLNRIDGGTALSNELTNVELEITNLEYKKIQAQLLRHQQMLSLLELIGLPLDIDLRLASDLNGLTIESSENMVPNDHSKIKFMNSEIEVSRIETGILDTEKYPVIAGYGSVIASKAGLNVVENDWESWGKAGINFNYLVFDWSRRARNVSVSKLRTEIMQNQLHDAVSKIALSIRQAELKLDDSLKLHDVLEKNFSAAEENSRMYRNLYEEGVIKATQYTDSLNDLEDARIQLVRGEIQIKIARAQLKFAKGEF